MSRPQQAVILCGGLGTRLRPLTDTLPKPMAPVNGRPFLAYLVQQLREQGIRRIVLLTGYRGEMIHDYFGDGTSAGVQITYSQGPTEWETGRRVWEARDQLDSTFMLLYSDNYAPFDLDQLRSFHQTRGAALTVIVQAKRDANLRLRADGMVDLYDRTRTAPGLDFVEIGYMIVDRDRVVPAIDDPDASFSLTLQRLAENGQIAGFITSDPYHSISDMDRLRMSERYLANKRILMIDRDGTINTRPPKAEYVTCWEQFHWVEPTVEAMRQLAVKGFQFIVLSNQAGVARGMIDADMLSALHDRMRSELAEQGIETLAVYVCPHHWDAGCECRKPAPGMFLQASTAYQLRLNRTIYIGDDPRDSLAAYNAGCASALVGPERHAADDGPARPEQTADTLLELMPWIVKRFEEWEAIP